MFVEIFFEKHYNRDIMVKFDCVKKIYTVKCVVLKAQTLLVV